jgi:hypothetical protein
VVQGNTEAGIETRFKNAAYPVQVGLSHVRELNEVSNDLSLFWLCFFPFNWTSLQPFFIDLVSCQYAWSCSHLN